MLESENAQEELVSEELRSAKDDYREAFFSVVEDIGLFSRDEVENKFRQFDKRASVTRQIMLELDSSKIKTIRTFRRYGGENPNSLHPIEEHLSEAFSVSVRIDYAYFGRDGISLYVDSVESKDQDTSGLIIGSDGQFHSKHVPISITDAMSYVDPYSGKRSTLDSATISAFGKLLKEGNDIWMAGKNISLIFTQNLVRPM